MSKYKLVIAVRRDLDMSPGKMAVQVAHGSVSAINKAMCDEKDEDVGGWYSEGQFKFVVKAKNENHLKKLIEQCKENNINYAEVRDFGHTELEPNTLTCVAIGPSETENVDNITKKLSLWK